MDKTIHDINSALSSILNAMELVQDQWKENQELVDKIVPLCSEKFVQLKKSLDHYYSNQ